ncbi:MmgE/PrpD family protein [uncultured Sphingomonas sp.]|uniref:MmgE/PrpD family protein n=1 Tax=uncultured Sphingomonas sp. TaxID=158754 RepID=UPI00261D6E04|nr:MmgE/PrpD family protein [uncultured Sphingomonas sp.]
MGEPNPSLTNELAKHLCRLVQTNVRIRARLHLLDWLGCVAGARRTAVADAARAGEPDRLLRAALLGNVLEMDDVHRSAILHPGPTVWPAALIVARETGATMDALLDAAVAGYEAAIAIGSTFDARHYAHWHNTATAGGFAAAGAAARLRGLDATRTAWALGNAGSVAGGLWHMRHAPAMTKQFHVGHAVRTGLWATQLADGGLTGPDAVLEGPQGLYEATTDAPNPMLLGEGWRIGEVSFKPWAACRHSHPAIDAALALKAEGALIPPFRLETYADAIAFCDRPEPETPAQAKFSLQHAIAVVAARGAPRPEDFEPTAIADPKIAELRAAVHVIEATDMTARYPHHFGARLMSGGASIELIDTLGDPERPLAPEGIIAKARTLIAWGGLPEAEADRAVALALDGDASPAGIVALIEDWI